MSLLDGLFRTTPVSALRASDHLMLALLVGFIVGQLNGWCYKWTHRGVSYSRTFTQALVLISIVAALSMSLVASNALIAVGLLGGLAIIRFRTVVRDARDTAYIFLCLICGMAAGFGFYGTAVAGALVANLAAVYLHATGFGAWYARDNLLRFQSDVSSLKGGAIEQLLTEFCRRHSVISVDESPASAPDGEPTCQCAYKIRLNDPEEGPELVAALKDRLRIHAIHLLIDQEHEEVA